MSFRPIVCYLFWILFHITLWQSLCNQMSAFRVSNINKCWQRDKYFARIFDVSLQRCVEECGKRQICKGINYRRKVKHCELVPTTTTADLVVNTIADGPCTSVHRNDMNTQPSCNCHTHKACDSTGNCNVQECLPFSITNGNFVGNLNNIDARVKFTCDSRYTEVNDESTAICLVNGTWSVTPQCNIACVDPPEIANSFILPGGNPPGLTRQYICVDNYGTTNDVQDMITTCLEDGSWSTTNFICVRDCDSPPEYPHSTIYYNRDITVGTYRHHCHYNYSTDNDNVITATTCLAGTNWPESNVTCFRVCGLPAVVGVNSTGMTRVYNCSDDYQNLNNESGTVNACLENGTWSATNVTCDWDCGSTLHYPNYSILINFTLAGTTRHYHCDADYSSENDRVVMETTCISEGNWTATNFSCYRVCDDPPEIANSVIGDGGNLPGDTHQYSCADDYGTLSNDVDMVTMCLRNGTWSDTNFTCDWGMNNVTRRYCGNVTISNGIATVDNGTTVPNIATITCNYGYRLYGENTLTCTPTGWDNAIPTCIDIDECDSATDRCDDNAECENTQGSFTCTCKSGYTGDGQSCTDVNECDSETDTCDDNAVCKNTQGSYTCICNSGYSGDGQSCTDVNECDSETSTCDDNAVCENTQGSYTCNCESGYTGDVESCTDVNECDSGTDTCDDNAECENTPGSYTCTCKSGYTGDGESCTDINECVTETGNCGANAECENTEGSYTCFCNGNPYTGQQCPHNFVEHNGSCYLFGSYNGFSWYSARTFCKDTCGSHLVHIDDQEENDWIVSQIENTAYWINLSDRLKEGKWIWDDTGIVAEYTNWYPNQPDNRNNQNCAIMKRNSYWYDRRCVRNSYKSKYVCELEIK